MQVWTGFYLLCLCDTKLVKSKSSQLKRTNSGFIAKGTYLPFSLYALLYQAVN